MIKQAEFRNVKVRYSDKGKGRVIVLLHGFLESLEIWDEFSAKLSKRFRVIAIDLPGHGETPAIGYVHSMELMAECVKSVLDSLELRKYVVVGHSMGGYIALAFAELFPQNLSGLCIFHSTAMPDSDEKKKDRDRVAEIVKKDHTQFVSDLIPKLFAQKNVPLLKDEVGKAKQIALNTPKEGIVAALLGMKERPSRELVLKNATYPVLFIIGKQDVILAWDNLLLLTSLPKKSFNIVLEHAGHMGFYEAPEETFKTVKKFSGMCFREKGK
ncbi:MAG: alpha/beta fold hydrolase [Bacteroidetes bacterium]|nr:alpha/beta fold hydrolase [Bacteroidota bacterium]